MNIKFSIVIPLYNKEKHIRSTIQSIFNQTFEDYEIIIINDGSTDNSLAIVENIKDPRICVFSKKNGGVSSARNFGIEKANYDYVAFLDADDEWEPDYLLNMKNLINRYPQCGVYGCAYKFVKNKTEFCSGTEVPVGIVDNFFEAKLKHNIIWTSATIVKTKLIREVGGFPIGMIGGEDDFTWSKVAKIERIAFTPKVLANYNFKFGMAGLRVGKADFCSETWFDLYEENNYFLNEYIALKACTSGIRHILGNHKSKSFEIEKQFRYTSLFKNKWRFLYLLNRSPEIILKFYRQILIYRMRSQ